jgi:hypothetical protein
MTEEEIIKWVHEATEQEKLLIYNHYCKKVDNPDKEAFLEGGYKITYCGEDWKQKGYARRLHYQLTGIHRWIYIFNEQEKFIL